MKRIFIGIKVQLEAGLHQVLDSVKVQFADERIKWVSAENLHVTLHFLGETTDVQIQEVCGFIQSEISSKKPFSFYLSGLSYFKRRSTPSALFFKLHQTEELVELASGLKAGLQNLGFNPGLSFNPHLTIGRIKHLHERKKFDKVILKLQESTRQVVRVENIVLFESLLNPTGAVYKQLKVFQLEG